MSNKLEKARRNVIKRALKSAEKEKILAALPIPLAKLDELFRYLDTELEDAPCENSTRLAELFIEKHQLPKQELLAWLRDNGGYCDCEILMNVEEKVNEN